MTVTKRNRMKKLAAGVAMTVVLGGGATAVLLPTFASASASSRGADDLAGHVIGRDDDGPRRVHHSATDDGLTHVQHSGGADDGSAHVQHSGGADDGLTHVHHSGGADDGLTHVHHSGGADDGVGHAKHGGADDGPGHS